MEEGLQGRKANRLIFEKSPYLLQHAYNPVDWYPWGEEAFSKAKQEGKPIFVSIGYSTCHWCHVMEKECFEDREVAALMNDAFVCIKIDREERPDLDSTFMAVCQLMNRNCGWPLNIVMTPEKNPFYAASYIPKDSRFGAPGMTELVPQIVQIWKTRKTELKSYGLGLMKRIETFEKRTGGNELGENELENAYGKLSLRFDQENGGFGNAPKFPTPHNLLFLLRYWNRKKEQNALNMVIKTLDSMRAGGIFDQIGFGFHRYSTDSQWLVPHFEKMLYDQAMLAMAYLEAFQATGSLRFKITATEIFDYVLRDMTSPEGGFYSAEDADSEGEEGRFYVWTKEEIQRELPSEEADLAIRLFGVTPVGNFSEKGGQPSGKNILHLVDSFADIAKELQMPVDQLVLKVGRIQQTLFAAREKRARPARDDKILTDWNGLMIAALARAGRVLSNQRYLTAAVKAATFIQKKLRAPNGRLWHRYAKGETAVEGFLDDYAFYAWGLIEIYEASFQEDFKEKAFEIIQKMIELFWDENEGGFFFTSKENSTELPAQKQVYDGALPSGNSVALLDLLLASRLDSDPRFEEISGQISKVFAQEIRESPSAHTFFLSAIDFATGPNYSVTLVGDPNEKDMKNFLQKLGQCYLPNAVVQLRTPDKRGLGFEQIEGNATAYVCRNKTCFPPTNKADELLRLLGNPRSNE